MGRLHEYKTKNGDLVFDFDGYSSGDDFMRIVRLIEHKISPDTIDYTGITDMSGFFEKDGLQVILEHDNWNGNSFVFKGIQSEDNVLKIRYWANQIFESMQ